MKITNKDYFIKALDTNKHFLLSATLTHNTLAEIQERHKTSSLVTSALGRMISGSVLLAAQIKDTEKLMMQISCDGPVEGLIAEATKDGDVRAYAYNNQAMGITPVGKAQVSSIIGSGILSVIKILEGRQFPYQSQVRLISGEIAKDISYYLATSEQIPSVIALGTYLNENEEVEHSGGFLIQALPGAEEEEIALLESNTNNIPPISHLMQEGMDAEAMLSTIMHGFQFKIIHQQTVQFKCNCNFRRVKNALIALGEKEIKSIIDNEGDAQVFCDFCAEEYRVSKQTLIEILHEMQAEKPS